MPDILVPDQPASTPATLQPVETLIDIVASLVGAQGDATGRAKALECLDRAADRMNMAGIFLFRQKEATFTSGSDFAQAADTITMPTDWGWPIDPIILRHANGDISGRGEWKSWDVWRQLQAGANDTAMPAYFAIRNELDGTIYMAPKANLADIGSITLSYIARIQRPSEATNASLALIPEAREALLAGGMALITQYRYLKYSNIWQPMMIDFKLMIEGARAATKRWLNATHPTAYPDESGHLGGYPAVSYGHGTVYIRI